MERTFLVESFYYANYPNDVLKIDESRKENEASLPFCRHMKPLELQGDKMPERKTYIISGDESKQKRS